jgi:hypothetical protein
MGGGMMGGMGSVPPTGVPFATLSPGQTRNLPTRLVSLNAPNEAAEASLPAKGEKLEIGEISQINPNPRTAKALKRLAEDKAPTSVSQLVLWNVSAGLDWATIARLSKDWANPHELTLAKSFVDSLGERSEVESGKLLYQVTAANDSSRKAADDLGALLKDKTILGLKATAGVPDQPTAPAIACKIRVEGDKAIVQLSTTDGNAKSWLSAGKFVVTLTKDQKHTSAIAEGIIERLVRAQVSTGARVKGKLSYKLKIENASPLLLNGLALLGKEGQGASETPKLLSGISIPPLRSMTVPASEEVVKELGLRKGVRVIAADLSGL